MPTPGPSTSPTNDGGAPSPTPIATSDDGGACYSSLAFNGFIARCFNGENTCVAGRCTGSGSSCTTDDQCAKRADITVCGLDGDPRKCATGSPLSLLTTYASLTTSYVQSKTALNETYSASMTCPAQSSVQAVPDYTASISPGTPKVVTRESRADLPAPPNPTGSAYFDDAATFTGPKDDLFWKDAVTAESAWKAYAMKRTSATGVDSGCDYDTAVSTGSCAPAMADGSAFLRIEKLFIATAFPPSSLKGRCSSSSDCASFKNTTCVEMLAFASSGICVDTDTYTRNTNQAELLAFELGELGGADMYTTAPSANLFPLGGAPAANAKVIVDAANASGCGLSLASKDGVYYFGAFADFAANGASLRRYETDGAKGLGNNLAVIALLPYTLGSFTGTIYVTVQDPTGGCPAGGCPKE